MSIYDVDFSQLGPRTLPPDKRLKNNLSYLAVLLSPLQWISNLWLRDYRIGSTAIPYVISTTYAKYDRVKQNTIIYESLVNGNTANPSDTTKWMIVQKNFIGLTERLLYTGQTLTLTYALNKRFNTNFVQPPSTSQIFISNNSLPAFPFIFGGDDQSSSDFFASDQADAFIDGYSFTGRFNLNINMPVAVYTALDPLDANRDKIVRSFVDKYLPSGITYTIITY